MFNRFGGKWIRISSYLKKRSPTAIKNRYYSVIRRQLAKTQSLNTVKVSKQALSFLGELKLMAHNYEDKIQVIGNHLSRVEDSIDVDLIMD
jgi:hypothetical protein